mmetsp:Transcript_27688/g.70125  ORF Transcript_27688/g.70125 Transcript_27688/m.70125 type:complete len:219 (+) Transcript_27688:406-1062(+)
MPLVQQGVVALTHRGHRPACTRRGHDEEFARHARGAEVPPLRGRRGQRHPVPTAWCQALASVAAAAAPGLAADDVERAYEGNGCVASPRGRHPASWEPLTQGSVRLAGPRLVELLALLEEGHALHAGIAHAAGDHDRIADRCGVVAAPCREHGGEILPVPVGVQPLARGQAPLAVVAAEDVDAAPQRHSAVLEPRPARERRAGLPASLLASAPGCGRC